MEDVQFALLLSSQCLRFITLQNSAYNTEPLNLDLCVF